MEKTFNPPEKTFEFQMDIPTCMLQKLTHFTYTKQKLEVFTQKCLNCNLYQSAVNILLHKDLQL